MIINKDTQKQLKNAARVAKITAKTPYIRIKIEFGALSILATDTFRSYFYQTNTEMADETMFIDSRTFEIKGLTI